MLNKEQIEELYLWLQGEEIETNVLIKSPKLSNLKAWKIIYFLQEHFKEPQILSDYIERCSHCKRLVDTEREHYNDKTHHCEDCE